MRKIAVAGSIIVDRLYGIGNYPDAGELAKITSVSRAGGGLVHNTGIDVRVFSPDIPVSAFGMVGDDDDGRYVVSQMAKTGMDISGIKVHPSYPTSFTCVMSEDGGERTFFAYQGANAEWGYEDFPFDKIGEGDIVLLGYFLLLEKVDRGDGLRILKELKRRGAVTAVDLVSENSDRYASVRGCLQYVDNLIVNEIEAARLAGSDAPPEELAAALIDQGVRERVIIHMPEKGVSAVRGGGAFEVPSVKIPSSAIRGKTGAGDAYCAGALSGIFRGCAEEEILRLGSVAAVGALLGTGATEAMKTEKELKEYVGKFK